MEGQGQMLFHRSNKRRDNVANQFRTWERMLNRTDRNNIKTLLEKWTRLWSLAKSDSISSWKYNHSIEAVMEAFTGLSGLTAGSNFQTQSGTIVIVSSCGEPRT